VSHPVGPARTFAKYEGKATTTAESALSAVQTAKLVADTATEGRSFGPYTGQVLGDAEESLAGLDGTFGSIQPPDDDADDLRHELGGLLQDAEEHVATLRIAVRRGERALPTDDLDDDIDALEAFLQDHA
jgi:hypothetical protein